jgi:hypothetical protein
LICALIAFAACTDELSFPISFEIVTLDVNIGFIQAGNILLNGQLSMYPGSVDFFCGGWNYVTGKHLANSNVQASSHGLHCGCKHGAIIDSTCCHFVSGFNQDNLRSDIHDTVYQEFATMLKWMGFPIRVEDKYEFRAADPNDNHRPDITILDPLGNDKVKRYLLDFAIASPIVGVTKGILKTGASRETVKNNPHRILLIRKMLNSTSTRRGLR